MARDSGKIIRRIAGELGWPDLAEALVARAAPTDLQSLLLHVYRERAARLGPADLLQQAERSAMLHPSTLEARALLTFDQAAFAAAAGFEGVELSPLCPLGTNRVLGAIDQNNVLSTARNVEVLADPTAALAILCARRRRDRAARAAPQRLCASHRCLRLQPVDVPGFTPHFRLFCLVSAGRDVGDERFEHESLREQLRCWLRLLTGLAAAGFRISGFTVEIGDMRMTEAVCAAAGIPREELRTVRAHAPASGQELLQRRGLTLPAPVADPAALAEVGGQAAAARLGRVKAAVTDPLAAEFPQARFLFDPARLQGFGYYPGLCVKFGVTDESGGHVAFGDGGFTAWTQLLLSDRKERLLATGVGSEFVCKRFGPAP